MERVQLKIIRWFLKDRGNRWVTTGHTFTKERAEYLAQSMEQLTGVTHEVVEA